MKIISGALTANSGEVVLDGELVPCHMKPKDRMDIGIAIIYQELNYLNEMTIAENLFMGRILVKGPLKFVDYKKMYEEADKLMRAFGMQHNAKTLMKDLTVAEKQMIEILRAVSKDVKILIMDEPTSSLNEVETRRLFELIADLKKKGVSILYISHKLEEVFELADRVQVMRDGKNVGVREIKDTTMSELVTLMVGREITDMYPKEEMAIGETILKVENLSCDIACDISFDVKRGEVLGLFGLIGSGRTEAVEGLLGIKALKSGEITFEGKQIRISDPIAAKKLGIGYIPSDRKQEGLVLVNTVKNNLTVTVLDQVSRSGVLSARKEAQVCDKWINKLGIKTNSINTEVNELSGGNQQKVVIAKWLATDPKVLIMNDPTRGIDVGAKVEIYKVMEALCRQGIAVIMVSSELPETMGITDRMIIFADGRIVGEVNRKEYNQKTILQAAVGGN